MELIKCDEDGRRDYRSVCGCTLECPLLTLSRIALKY